MVTTPLEAVPHSYTLGGGGSLLSLHTAPPRLGEVLTGLAIWDGGILPMLGEGVRWVGPPADIPILGSHSWAPRGLCPPHHDPFMWKPLWGVLGAPLPWGLTFPFCSTTIHSAAPRLTDHAPCQDPPN